MSVTNSHHKVLGCSGRVQESRVTATHLSCKLNLRCGALPAPSVVTRRRNSRLRGDVLGTPCHENLHGSTTCRSAIYEITSISEGYICDEQCGVVALFYRNMSQEKVVMAATDNSKYYYCRAQRSSYLELELLFGAVEVAIARRSLCRKSNFS